MGRRATINDVAAAAGVSVSTVSKAVHGRYGVSPDTMRRVLDVVEKLGYQSSLGASSMRSHRTGVIGVLVPAFEPFSAEILKGVGAAVRGTGLDLLAYSGSQDGTGEGWERRSVSRLSGTLIDGVIMVTPTVVAVGGSEVPIVAIDPHTGPADLPTVESDSFHGAQLAARYLIELGHTRIGFISGRPDLRSSVLRDAGYRSALLEAGIPFDPRLVGVGRYQEDASRELAQELLSQVNRPTAIFAANDLSAIAVLAVAAELGISVPDELSVIGFDDIPEASRHVPSLTTVRQPMQRLGEVATKMLIALMNGEQPDQTHLRLPTRLVPRATTAPPL
ncbi:LacI family DNA-binding transcriptional regulator [uncultured Microbacterium sp.]|uniref:LacI family DNA-binding transcriptional regulator n=1 Tax=uncultured Microbacterium sp. TaxID=191216 RepID=UPI0028D66E7A|nr:LacI family DNA-binding transcriptional regulator [uncultured Microbacterium sp.]